MATDYPHVGDVGTTLQVTVEESGTAVDISGATTKEITLEAPSGDAKDRTASFTTDGTDGKIEYDTQDGDLDEAGNWEIQAYVELPNDKHHTQRESFYVEANL